MDWKKLGKSLKEAVSIIATATFGATIGAGVPAAGIYLWITYGAAFAIPATGVGIVGALTAVLYYEK